MMRVLGEELLSHYLGILLIAPLMIMVLRTKIERRALTSLLMDGLLVMLPSMTILLVLSEQAAPQPQFARVLSLAPVLFFAFRHGWRGASLAMIISSLGMTMVDQRLGHAPSSAAAYLFLAVAGTGALMLGSATDALRRSSKRVAEQNVYLGAVNRRLDQLAHQLRGAARGNLQADENQRRHLAAELHDELGQNITAIQTHVKLAQARLIQAGMEDISTSINTILAHMRRALHRLLDDLRPAVLDEFGLLRALDEGPIRDLLNTAGMAYHTDLHGDPRLLDDDTRTAIYRLAQESATNAVKHAQASEFRLRLRIGERRGIALAVLDLRDDGTGLPHRLPRSGRGLQGMRDRVTSLGGQFRLRADHAGVHLRILLRSTNVVTEPCEQN
jgi:two-component system sensor histidine kinase UhpB